MADPEQLAELLTIADHATQNQLLRSYENWLTYLTAITTLNAFVMFLTLLYITTHR